MVANLNAVPYQSAVWAGYYRQLPGILTDNPMAPMRNILTHNVLIRSGTVTNRMEAPFKDTAAIYENREVQKPTPADLRQIEKMRRAAGLVSDSLRKSLHDSGGR
jgi:hypothetical protein